MGPGIERKLGSKHLYQALWLEPSGWNLCSPHNWRQGPQHSAGCITHSHFPLLFLKQLPRKFQTLPVPQISHGHSWRACGVPCAVWTQKLWARISPVSGTHDIIREMGWLGKQHSLGVAGAMMGYALSPGGNTSAGYHTGNRNSLGKAH